MHPLTLALMEVLMTDLGARVHNSARHSILNYSIAFELDHRNLVSSLLHALSLALLGWLLGYNDVGLSLGDHFRVLGMGHIWC